jgi:hypothetical protein
MERLGFLAAMSHCRTVLGIRVRNFYFRKNFIFDVRFCVKNVRFTPENGHVQCN